MSTSGPLWSLFLGCLLALCWVPAAQACEPLRRTQLAAAQGQTAEADAQARAAQHQSACTATERTLANRIAGLAHYNDLALSVLDGASWSNLVGDLQQVAQQFGGPWQVFDALAEQRRAEKDYGAALRYYNLALDQIDDVVLTPDFMAPDADYIRQMQAAATEMRLASDQTAPMSSRASGCSFSTRGIAIVRTTVPVRFVFGRTEFTEQGGLAAQELLACLKLQAPEGILLVGHTDPIGTREDNQTLSEARAVALAHYLTDSGYAGRIETAGRGEDEPFLVDDASAYDQPTLFQIFRRVDVELR